MKVSHKGKKKKKKSWEVTEVCKSNIYVNLSSFGQNSRKEKLALRKDSPGEVLTEVLVVQ